MVPTPVAAVSGGTGGVPACVMGTLGCTAGAAPMCDEVAATGAPAGAGPGNEVVATPEGPVVAGPRADVDAAGMVGTLMTAGVITPKTVLCAGRDAPAGAGSAVDAVTAGGAVMAAAVACGAPVDDPTGTLASTTFVSVSVAIFPADLASTLTAKLLVAPPAPSAVALVPGASGVTRS